MATESESDHILFLSRELLDDIELQRLEADKLLLKCSRLARLAGTDEIKQWIKLEIEGYSTSKQLSDYYMSRTGRWSNFEEQTGYWGPLAQIEENIRVQRQRIDVSKVESLSGDGLIGAMRMNRDAQQALAKSISSMVAIRSRVLNMLHTFVVSVYYEREFAKVAESTFEQYKKDVDALIAAHAGDVLEKLPSVVARLREGGDEAISQALTTCRRIIDSFADAIYPPQTGSYNLGGNDLSLDASKHQNRINVYVAERTESKSRRIRIRQNLANLYDRVSTGVHTDVTTEEAFSLFLNVYLFLGEVLHLGEAKKKETAVA
ncbi:hypothetical protein [Sphingomonas sp. Leaf28]|uniref:AbiTii domain-containing protein n=1 Tax=Sphingomonas sp. Leaf28 TaxID=1735695 RepID=UPI0006FA1C34|nr:hypothetical protein [Sphingomonas sp. Leaf28]KQN08351.1 hypothetical protein ASE79_16555 [Sphingomonas sp. Leaf28]